ncbi:MAG TPA: ModE family transcriptional regulator [Ohtaekwangia sp.]|uniref:winged helix-turn-helix domain-containing protein n=1 Tax=Ohtaekwangia sp. TaxID=2066019 RepID=UPI002F954B7A
MKKKEIRLRCWIDIDGVRFFGPGRAELLEYIETTGSISKAAKEMGMSYKKAWAMIDDINSRASKPYVILQKGGQKGGGAELTEPGKKAVASYKKLTTKLYNIIDKETELLKHL